MAGTSRNEADLIARVTLEEGLRQYAQVSQKLLADQTALTNELVRKNFKKPAIFKTGTAFQACNKYIMIGSDPVTEKYLENWNPPTIQVFNIQDADVVRIAGIVLVDGAADASESASVTEMPLVMAYALSPTDLFNPIPSDQFSLMANMSIGASVNQQIGSNLTTTLTVQFSEDIPCSGNKYLHIFGLISNGGGNLDFFMNAISIFSPAFFTYSLIK